MQIERKELEGKDFNSSSEQNGCCKSAWIVSSEIMMSQSLFVAFKPQESMTTVVVRNCCSHKNHRHNIVLLCRICAIEFKQILQCTLCTWYHCLGSKSNSMGVLICISICCPLYGRNGDAAPCALDQWKTRMFHLKSRSCWQTCLSSEEMLRNSLQTNNCFKSPQETPTRKIDKYATDSNVSKDCIIMTNRRKKIS